jgi:hypothetical protein
MEKGWNQIESCSNFQASLSVYMEYWPYFVQKNWYFVQKLSVDSNNKKLMDFPNSTSLK